MTVDALGWVFDLDGTLTRAVHDFGAMKRQLGLDEGQPLMEGLEALEPEARAAAWAVVEDWEVALAEEASAAVGAEALLARLVGQGIPVGILTRNTREVALRTLQVTGLGRWFDPVHVLGRTCCAPKPDPAGVLRLAGAWSLAPSTLVMVGDAESDVESGLAAGARAVRVAPRGPTQATWRVDGLDALLG